MLIPGSNHSYKSFNQNQNIIIIIIIISKGFQHFHLQLKVSGCQTNTSSCALLVGYETQN